MKKKLLVVTAVLAVASSAMAVEMVVIPKITNALSGAEVSGVYPRGITPDGRFVGGVAGLGTGSGGTNTGFVFDAATGAAGQIVGGGYNSTVDGIGYWSDGTNTHVVVEGSDGGWQSMNSWNTATNWPGTTPGDSSTYWTKVRRTSTHEYYGSGQNRVAGNSSGGLLHGVFQKSATELLIDSYDGVGVVATPDMKSTVESSTLNGISNAGVAVGHRNNRHYTLTYTGTGGAVATYVNAGPDGTDAGQLYDIADDGSIMGGYGKSALPGNWPFVYDGVTSTQLPLLTSGALYATNGSVYSISPNGEYAVGMDYSYGYELAVLWDLRDMNSIEVVDLTAFADANGVLGPFDGNLRRATGVGINGDGDPVITGIGWAESLDDAGWTGFVLTIPEPTTVLFLALGGLTLLRRRR